MTQGWEYGLFATGENFICRLWNHVFMRNHFFIVRCLIRQLFFT